MQKNNSKPASLTKKERLKSRNTILRLFTLNQSLLLYPFKIVWDVQEHPKPFQTQLAVSVSKRSFKKAVDRNLIKRRMREVYRQNKQILSTPLQEHNIQLSFMVIYVAKDMVPYNEMEARMKKILVRLADKAAKRVEF